MRRRKAEDSRNFSSHNDRAPGGKNAFMFDSAAACEIPIWEKLFH